MKKNKFAAMLLVICILLSMNSIAYANDIEKTSVRETEMEAKMETTTEEELTEVSPRLTMFYSAQPYVNGFFGANFTVPYTCNCRILLCFENKGGTARVNVNCGSGDRYINVPQDGQAHVYNLGTVPAGTHKFDIWTTSNAVINIYEY